MSFMSQYRGSLNLPRNRAMVMEGFLSLLSLISPFLEQIQHRYLPCKLVGAWEEGKAGLGTMKALRGAVKHEAEDG